MPLTGDMVKLTGEQLDHELRSLKGWKREGDFITKQFSFKAFMDGIRFVDGIAKIAERQDHHPDVHIRWTTITLLIQTHDEGGVTALDVKLAKEIEKYLHKKQARP